MPAHMASLGASSSAGASRHDRARSASSHATASSATPRLSARPSTQNLLDHTSTFDEDEELNNSIHEEATQLAKTSCVWPILQMIRQDVNTTIDTGLSWSELTGHELNFAVVRPLAVKYSKLKSTAILYAMLLTRIHFLRQAERDLAFQNINQTRADLCEILAIKLLRTFAADGAELVIALSTPFWPLAGSSEEVKDLAQRRGYDCDHFPNQQSSSTLQLAIYSQAKKFIATPLVQKCVDGIWNGQIVLGNSSAGRGAIIEDSYKRRPVSFYDPRTAPFLDYHRLRVPRIRSFLEVANFAFILTFYVLCLASKGSQTWTIPETLYTIWLTGLALDELAQFREHTPAVYFGSLFNVLDALFCVNGFCWLGIRISALVSHSPARSDFSFDVLALGAILLCPRLASLLISDNVLMLALRAMVVEFGYFFGLALVFFSGFLWTFWSLADSPKWTPTRISWLMLRFTFGNTISFEEAQQFSAAFGPVLVVAFTILSQTLLLTVLISLLSATFARVAEHAQEESLYQHSFATLQGASSEALFSYFPPLNIICLLTILPASFTLTPRWTHKLNVFIIRTTHFPILLAIRVVQQLQWGRSIELANEKSGQVFGRWRWGSKRGSPDIIEIVFGDMTGHSGTDSELSKRFPAAKPFSTTYAGQSVVQHLNDPSSDSDKQSQRPRLEQHDEARTADSTQTAETERVQWADETGNFPDSPGATIRKAKASAGTTSALALARRDTFKDLAKQVDDEVDGEEEDDDESHVLIPVELVDEGVVDDAQDIRAAKRRRGKGSRSSASSKSSGSKSRKAGGASKSSLSPLSRVIASGRSVLGSGTGGFATSPVPEEPAASTQEPDESVRADQDPDTSAGPSTGSAFSAYRLYRNSRSALLGKRRALSDHDVMKAKVSDLIIDDAGAADVDGESESGSVSPSSSSSPKRQVRIATTHERSLTSVPTSSTSNTAGLASLSRILNRKDTFDVGEDPDNPAVGGAAVAGETSTDSLLEQREGGNASVQAIREVMLSFLERLDDQAESVQRIEKLLEGVVRDKERDDGENKEKQGGDE